MRRRVVLGFLALFAVFGCDRDKGEPALAPSAQVGQLDAGFEPLGSDFEAASRKVRVVALLSPT